MYDVFWLGSLTGNKAGLGVWGAGRGLRECLFTLDERLLGLLPQQGR